MLMFWTLAFETEEIVHILHKTDVDPQFKRNNSKKGTRRDRLSLQHTLNNHENVNDEQICTIQLKENRSAKCSGLSCKKILQRGTPCIKVDGALTVPYGKEVAMKQLFYFCATRECFTRPPVWSNIRPNVDIRGGETITEEELYNLNKSSLH